MPYCYEIAKEETNRANNKPPPLLAVTIRP